jgi:hypothetical protein
VLKKDKKWPNIDWRDNLLGFFISEEEELCPYIEENGWNYALFNKDKGFADIDSIVGAFGNDWKFKS